MTVVRDPTMADKIIAFLRKLPITDGEAAGQPFTVDPWQEAWIRDVYEPVKPDGRRVVRSAILSCARKNAKTALIAGLILAHLIGPASVFNGQIYSAAVDRDQARVVFKMVVDIIEMTPWLKRSLWVRDHVSIIEVTDENRGSYKSTYKALSAVVKSKHGLGADFFVYDEFGEASDRALWDVLFDSQQLRANPLATAISTQNDDPSHPFTKMIDNQLANPVAHNVVHVYSAPEGCALDDKEGWLAANPALATWKKEASIATAAADAINDPSLEANFRLRYLNQRVSAESQFFRSDIILAANPNGEAPSPTLTQELAATFKDGEEVYIGLDVAKRTDFTALAILSADYPHRVKAWFFKPKTTIASHGKRDHRPYAEWAKAGWIITPEGETVPGEDIADLIVALAKRYRVKALVYDFNHADDVIRHVGLKGKTVGKDGTFDILGVRWGNGGNDGTKAVNAIGDAFLTRNVRLDGNPVMNMCLSNAVVKEEQDKRRLIKPRATARIDGAVALSIAMAMKQVDRDQEKVAFLPFKEGFQIPVF